MSLLNHAKLQLQITDEFRTWMSNYIPLSYVDVITYPNPDLYNLC